MRAAWIVVLAGCWGTAPAPRETTPPRAVPIVAVPGVAEVRPPRPVPAKTRTLERYSGRDLVTTHLSRDEVVLIDRQRNVEQAAYATSDLDFLGPCMSDFVKAQPITSRTVLLEAFGRYATTCRGGVVTLDRPLGCNSGERRARSDVALAGPLSSRGVGLVLRVSSCGTASTFDRVILRGGGATWTSPRVELVHDHYGCDVAELPVTRTLANTLRAMVEQDDAMIAFEGTDAEIALDDTLRDELRSVLAAVDSITGP